MTGSRNLRARSTRCKICPGQYIVSKQGLGGGGEKKVLPFCVTGYFAPKFRDQKQPNQEPKPKGQVSLGINHTQIIGEDGAILKNK